MLAAYTTVSQFKHFAHAMLVFSARLTVSREVREGNWTWMAWSEASSASQGERSAEAGRGAEVGARERRTFKQGQVHCCIEGDDPRAKASDRQELVLPRVPELMKASDCGGAKLDDIPKTRVTSFPCCRLCGRVGIELPSSGVVVRAALLLGLQSKELGREDRGCSFAVSGLRS